MLEFKEVIIFIGIYALTVGGVLWNTISYRRMED